MESFESESGCGYVRERKREREREREREGEGEKERYAFTLPTPPPHLVDEVLVVLVGERLRGADDLVQVGVHQLVNGVDIVVPGWVGGMGRVEREHDVSQGRCRNKLN
jgi:hypothetical protein